MSILPQQIEHHYPEQVTLLSSHYLSSLVTQLSQPETRQPYFNELVKEIYRQMLEIIMNHQWPTLNTEVATRMTSLHPEQRLLAQVFDPKQKAVCVDVARAGMLPSQVFFDHLNWLVDPDGVRQDHVYAARLTNEKGEVTQTHLSDSKIGGDIQDQFVFLPDPMGATGLSLCEVIDHYKKNVDGQPKKFIAVHMIVTPEYIRQVTNQHPDVQIYAARLDRGLSSSDALKLAPGQLWEQEKGLNDSQYIVPGAGGVGELINNAFV